ncbi:Multicopper oxidase type 1 [Botryosphaeria dothidea]|uniref:Multicopper oxidase type 1 n=1 Tax=Botryosphaeria dothidea TaxID=55169 RepID=A0A8H4ISQ2_9PEZI|nr:Multicopper oxidase type 1 [Botryosphaeria dothidea]
MREYNLTLEASWMAKDGNPRGVLTINGDTPGPLIWGDEGDTLRVTVTNKMFIEATMHWHGVYQVDKYWNDGVPGVTQWPIEPRDSYTYEFTLTNQTGIYFYHGHFGPAFADGQRGPLWIRPASWRPRPYDLISTDPAEVSAMRAAEDNPRHLMVSDWNYEGMEVLMVGFRDAGIAPACSASLVTNGKGRTTCLPTEVLRKYDPEGLRDSLGCLPPNLGAEFMNKRKCRDTLADFEVIQAKEGEKYLFLNFIHPGAHHELRIAVDEHDMIIVAADGDFVMPKRVQAINLNMGERISVLVPLDKKPGEYAIRMSSLSQEQLISGLSILRYPGVQEHRVSGAMQEPQTKPHIDLMGRMITEGGAMMDEMADLSPFPPRAPPATSDHTFRFLSNRTGPSEWVLASEPHQGFRQQMPPIMWNEESRGPTTIQGMKNGSTVDIIFESRAYAMHPFHKHNHKAWIIGRGKGYFRWPDVATALKEAPENFNMIDPPLRDGARLEAEEGSWTVIRYTITFPAMSMLHCHRIQHFAAGQQIVLLEGQDVMQTPPEYIKKMVHADFVPPLRYGPLD